MENVRADLLLLTWAAGAMDALSYLTSGVFTANMTGNTVVLGLAIVGPDRSRLISCLTSLAAFSFGALIAAVLLVGKAGQNDASRDLKIGVALEYPFVLLFALVSWLARRPDGDSARLLLISSASCALGIQSVAVRELKIAGVVTTFMTGTITTAIVALIPTATPDECGQIRPKHWPLALAGLLLCYVLATASTAALVTSGRRNMAVLVPIASLAAVLVRAFLRRPEPATFDSL